MFYGTILAIGLARSTPHGRRTGAARTREGRAPCQRAATHREPPSRFCRRHWPRQTLPPRSRRLLAQSRYIPALDGLRTLAVVAVVLYHLNLAWAQGGLLGVTIFFVLSGYLITRLLLNEVAEPGHIDLKSFWIRRIRRLVPAVVTVVVVTCALCTVFNHVMLTKMRPDILPSLLFFNNWWQIMQTFVLQRPGRPLAAYALLVARHRGTILPGWPPLLFAMVSMHVSKPNTRRMVLGLAAVYRPCHDGALRP